MTARSLILVPILLLAAQARADVHCPTVFGDHMVLQRERPIAVWGDADPGEKVAVAFSGEQEFTTADASGHWSVRLGALPANEDPQTLTIRGRNTLEFSDVLVGEVWLCSGQSNMEKPLGPRRGQKPTDNYEQAIAEARYPEIRLYQVPWWGKPSKKQLGLTWVACTPDSIKATDFSAAAYYFGRELYRQLHVPIGIIHSSFGGTQIEAWIPASGYADHPAIRGIENVRYAAWVKGVQATELYQSMIAPLVPFTVRGFLWYQGESNVMQADGAIYADKMRALIDSWRRAWDEPDAPWYYVLIAPFDYSKWNSFPKLVTPEELPVFWEAQARALSIPHTGMVVTTDLVKDLHDIHPTDKLDVGLRLARLALADTYRRHDLLAYSPSFATMRHHGGGKVELRFNDAGAGLKTRDGQAPDDFTIAGRDRRFVPAQAMIRGDRVVVSSPEVADPVAVRFGWNETDTPNLVNSAGLPAIPFRTDDWPVVTERPRPPEPTKK
ncbi:MAG TPA: sialate O-acetylesterase [Opitutaceae bacterium]|nr:sialate O-acetylesterase [Opitutaceae bacterium]